MSARLERSNSNRVIAGVCGGIAEYLQVDATLVRVFFVIAAFATAGLAFLGYLVLLVLMPLPGRPTPFVRSDTPPAASAETPPDDAVTAAARPVVAPPDPEATERRRETFGYALIALGIVFLAGTAGFFSYVNWRLLWPLVLIGIGVLLLVQRARR